MNPFSLKGKTTLIIGASSGIGRATAIQCSSMGASVIAVARNRDNLNETLKLMQGESHIIYPIDITNSEASQKFINNLPILDGVVLCAGIGAMKPFLYSSRKDFNRVFELNVFATIETLRLIVKGKKLAKGGSVVIVSSIGGIYNHTVGNSIYGASKAAINSIMKYCAIEFAPKRIRVNSVNPGMIKTEFNRPDIATSEQLQNDISKYPLKRFGEPVDVANAIVYLLSDASSWVTGISLVVDGGFTAK